MKPNIIFYFSDQQRWDTFNETLMPNVWELGEEGTFFENCYTCQPVCGPARACLQTGQYATENKCYWNGIPLQEDTKTLADYFNENGYDTAYIGKWHLASDRYPGIGLHCEKTAVPKDKQGGYKYWRAADVLEFTSHGYETDMCLMKIQTELISRDTELIVLTILHLNILKTMMTANHFLCLFLSLSLIIRMTEVILRGRKI